MKICRNCHKEFIINGNKDRPDCTRSCYILYKRYEHQINVLHYRLVNKIYSTSRHKRKTDGILLV